MVHMDCQSVWPTIKKNVIFKQNTMIQTKQCTNKPKMIKRITYLKRERKCVKPMKGEEDKKPQRRRSLLHK